MALRFSLIALHLAAIDAMKLHKNGTPQDAFLMRTVTLSIRVGTAAYFAGKQADDMLGRYGHWLKYFFEVTRGRNLTLRVILKRKNAQNLIGIGGQYIVLKNEDSRHIDKYNYPLAGADPKVLTWTLDAQRRTHETMRSYFGTMLEPTEYDLARLPIRGPAKRLLTLRARQHNLTNRIDLFSPEAAAFLASDQGAPLQKTVKKLHAQTIKAMKENIWLDTIGPENIVIVNAETKPHIRIIDIEPYIPEYLDVINPMTGKTYKETFLERLTAIEKLAQK